MVSELWLVHLLYSHSPLRGRYDQRRNNRQRNCYSMSLRYRPLFGTSQVFEPQLGSVFLNSGEFPGFSNRMPLSIEWTDKTNRIPNPVQSNAMYCIYKCVSAKIIFGIYTHRVMRYFINTMAKPAYLSPSR